MVIWTGPAKKHLLKVHDFVARESQFYASKIVSDIIDKTELLMQFPLMGRVVPELKSPHTRELFVYSYRIIYDVIGKDVNILAIVHMKSDFSPTKK